MVPLLRYHGVFIDNIYYYRLSLTMTQPIHGEYMINLQYHI